MTRTVVLVARLLLSLSAINAASIYGKDHLGMDRFGRDLGYHVSDAGSPESWETLNNDDKYFGVHRRADMNEEMPFDYGTVPWHISNSGQGAFEHKRGLDLGNGFPLGNGFKQHLMKRFMLGPYANKIVPYRVDQRQRRGQLYLNHLARMNK